MEVVLILTGALLAVGVPLWWLDRRHLRRQAQTAPESAADDMAQGQSEDEDVRVHALNNDLQAIYLMSAA